MLVNTGYLQGGAMKKEESTHDVLEELKVQVKNMRFDHESDKQLFLKNILKMQQQQINILVVGATGVGKSSTINALFKCDKAVVGRGVDPETMHIEKYDMDGITFWDSPGLGDGITQDEKHANGIVELLHKLDENNQPLIDLVLVLLDGGSRDYGTAYRLLEQVIVPSLDKERHGRVLVAINQADMAMKGRGWDENLNQPSAQLEVFLDEKATSTRRRILESTGVDMHPIYYCAGYKDEYGERAPYNLAKLLYYIVEHMPKHKRFGVSDKINKAPELYKAGQESQEFLEKTKRSFWESLAETLSEGIDFIVEAVPKVIEAAKSIGRWLSSIF